MLADNWYDIIVNQISVRLLKKVLFLSKDLTVQIRIGRQLGRETRISRNSIRVFALSNPKVLFNQSQTGSMWWKYLDRSYRGEMPHYE